MNEARRRATQRWAVVGLAVAALVSLPSLVAALPARDADDVPAAALLAQIRGSADVMYEGYAESHGRLALPDVEQLGDLVQLFGGTTRARVWWGGPERWRVDTVEVAGETGVYYDGIGTWVWHSGDQRVVRITGAPPVRLPRTADLLPAELARRLAGAAAPDEVSRLPGRRVAGRSALGLRITPRTTDTTLGRIDIWVDPSTGLPVRVEVFARGASDAALVTSMQDLRYADVSVGRTSFVPPFDSSVSLSEAPDIAALVDRFAPYALPPSLIGLPRRDRVGGLGLGVGGEGELSGGAATYGDGYTLLVVLPLPESTARPFLRRLRGPLTEEVEIRGAEAVAIQTPLVNALVAAQRTDDDRVYLLAGTVPQELLERAAAALVANPPPFREVAVERAGPVRAPS